MTGLQCVEKCKKDILTKKNVVGIYYGLKHRGGHLTDERCVVVMVSTKVPLEALADKDRVPKRIHGEPTDVLEVGEIQAFRTDRVRPAPMGVSIGHVGITAGTAGCLVEKNGEQFILSNNHVIANSNDAALGDPVLQPGPADGGREDDDTLATLEDYEPVVFGAGIPIPNCPVAGFFASVLNFCAACVGAKTRLKATMDEPATNTMDAAIARPVVADDVDSEIFDLAIPSGAGLALVGDYVQKSGRTTGYTEGNITGVGATIQVQYGAGKIALFENQIVSDIASDGGDSGSAILNEYAEVVGLLFAGGNGITILNPIGPVLERFGVSIVTL